MTLPIRQREFRSCIELDRPRDFAFPGVDGRYAVGAAIEGENTLGRWIINDRTRLRPGFHLPDACQRLQIEDRHRGSRAVAGEAAPQFGSYRDLLGAARVVDFSHRLVGIRIEDFYLIEMRNVDAPRGAIHRGRSGNIAVAGHRDFFQQAVLAMG